MEVCRATDLCHQRKSRTHCFLITVRPRLQEKSSHKCIWCDIKTLFRAWSMLQAQYDWEADVKRLVVSIFDRTIETSAAPTHTNAWLTPSYTQETAVRSSRTRHTAELCHIRAVEEMDWIIYLPNEKRETARRESQREDRCQMCVVKRKENIEWSSGSVTLR